MYNEAIDTAKEKMEKTKDVYKRELQSLRAGRANPQLLDHDAHQSDGQYFRPRTPAADHLSLGC